jgi:hypothetical protein
MHVIDGLSESRRVVVVITPGLALGVIGTYLVSLGSGIRFGWYGYSPLTATLQQASGLPA